MKTKKILLWSAIIAVHVLVFAAIISAILLNQYKIIRSFGMYDHISYNNTAYYIFDKSVVEGEPITPDFGENIVVVLVDKNGRPYSEGESEEAYLCQNDDEKKFIYYGSAYYTNDEKLLKASKERENNTDSFMGGS